MAAPYGQQPWNNAEKVYLLAEIIKLHCASPERLYNIVVNNILGPQEPNWQELPLPPGRSLNSSLNAFHELRRTASMQQPGPTSIMSTMAPAGSPLPAPLNLKRHFPFDSSGLYSAGREIRPKPTSSFGQFGPQRPEQPAKKKRGRPTKAEAQARADAQSASSEPSPAGPAPRPSALEMPIPQPQIAPRPEPLSIEPVRVEETRPSQIARMPISSMLTPTGQKSNSQSSSSSGKRRRGRSTRTEPEDYPMTEAPTSRQQQEYESPYARMATDLQDSPARTAVLRHRDEPDSVSSHPGMQQQPGAQDTPFTTAPPAPLPPPPGTGPT